MTAKKIFNIVSGNPSGALNVSMTISNFLKNNGYNVINIFRKYNNTSLENITVIKDKFILDYILSLSKLIRAFQPDLIMVHGYSTHIWTKFALAHSKMDVKLIHIEHNTEKYTILRRYLTKYLDKYTTKYICVSQTVAEHLKKQYINKNKVSVIYNGIEIKKFSEVPKKTHDIFTIGMVARFAKQKDHLTLIKAVEYLIKNHNETVNLILMGTGKTKSKCENYVNKHDLNNNVFFTTGKFTDLIPQIDTFVLSTHYEGQGLVACEAMASKCPVLFTDISVARELITDNYNGLLFPPEDYKSLAHCLLQIKHKKIDVDFLINNGYNTVCQKFAESQMLQSYLVLIQNLI
ncbi:glycosyltransferase family 4 protein [Pectinatus brassicae]|uniref:Glycosyltransferase involved in cell wall biosynthesis n=1 Tax=Pectinatus brassicae TaxID=862415 RepID=A0A840USY0_9FIRM|nr:glycosyltransferase family 4 protein [Pectinatus brassicae]MBB5335924.1 glycosyltransferase involved in cell wall biosynthesis [Pectinatus brassicae]